MGMFDSILATLGFGSAQAKAPEAKPKAPDLEPIFVEPSARPAAPKPADVPTLTVTPVEPAKPAAIAVVDVVAQLEARAAKETQKLNWRTSIVDLLKLLDIDSSLGARKELAKELDCPGELMSDSAKMNVWLHKAVLARLAANGGNVPADLID